MKIKSKQSADEIFATSFLSDKTFGDKVEGEPTDTPSKNIETCRIPNENRFFFLK